MRYRFLILFIFINLACSPKISEEDIKKVEKFDPQFKAVLDKEKEVDLRISSLKNKIATEKADMEVKISVLRDEFQNKKAGLEAEIAKLRQELEPERKAIKGKIEKLKHDLKLFETRLANIKGMLKHTQNLIKKSQDTDIALQDKTSWDAQIKKLETEKIEVEREIKGLKEKIGLYSLELKIIK